MKKSLYFVPAPTTLAVILSTLLLIGNSASGPLAAQTSTPKQERRAVTIPAKPQPSAAPQPAAQDYLVQINKHAMWKSQIEKMHPELAKTAKPLSKKAGTDYPVQIGKTTVMASTLRRVDGPNTTRPAPQHSAACKDYLVQSGKKTVWASEIGAPCPAGPHVGKQKPLCCVVSVTDEKSLPPCCRDAQGK